MCCRSHWTRDTRAGCEGVSGSRGACLLLGEDADAVEAMLLA